MCLTFIGFSRILIVYNKKEKKNMRTWIIHERIKTINCEIETAKTSAVRFFDDPCEVAHWYAVIDELVLERNQLVKEQAELDARRGDGTELSAEEREAAALDYAIRLATYTDREM